MVKKKYSKAILRLFANAGIWVSFDKHVIVEKNGNTHCLAQAPAYFLVCI